LDVRQDTVSRPLQSERFPNPPRNLFRVHVTFSFDDGKRDTAKLSNTQIKQVATVGNSKRAFLIFSFGLIGLLRKLSWLLDAWRNLTPIALD
jgi:hypothetical protein